jgi:hypothetical protein
VVLLLIQAGSNRMLRFAKSLKSVDEEVIIVSPANEIKMDG